MARTKVFPVRLSDNEWQMLQLLADAEGLNEADYVRTQIILLFRQSGLKLK
jgi:hypothetical protein